MIASAAEMERAAWRRVGSIAFLLWVLVALVGGCRSAGPPPGAALEPLPRLRVYVPDRTDHLAHDAAVAGLLGDGDGLDRARARLGDIDGERQKAGEPRSGLLPYALDLDNAGLGDAILYRRATRELLERDDVDPSLRGRLEVVANDDPVRLADQRIGDARRVRVAREFNALVEPVGRSLLSGAMLPVQLARALVGIGVARHLEDELTAPERQALFHWKALIEAHPDSPEAAALLERVEESQRRWYRTQRDRHVRAARAALDLDHAAAALLLANQALAYAPEDREASVLRDRARALLGERRAEQDSALEPGPEVVLTSGRSLAIALLLRPEEIGTEALALLDSDPAGPLADEARYAAAIALSEEDREDEAWDALEEVARDPDASMSAHAWASLASSHENPYRLFRVARSQERGKQTRWLALGRLASGPLHLDLPRVIEWAVALPDALDVGMGLPSRLLSFPWNRPTSRAPAVQARRYLARYPDGVHAPELRDWLESYEAGEGNWITAAALAEQNPDADPEHVATLRGRASQQALEVSLRARRRDVRLAMLQRVTRDFGDTDAARTAADEIRRLLAEATPQRIRISRGFLLEHRDVAGPHGLALRPTLLDGDLGNGELHAEGITLLGGHALELSFVNERGEQRGEPLRRRQQISQERLVRIVGTLEEASLRAARSDPDFSLTPDADRDLFFERVRLGLADRPDARASAESTYAFLGTREHPGLVRVRESLLPVDLVLQVSGSDLGMGGFPRLRAPRPTEDAILYE